MHYNDLPTSVKTSIQGYADAVIENARNFLLGIGCTMPQHWNVVDCLVCGSLGLHEDNAYGNIQTDTTKYAMMDEIDLRFICSGPLEDVQVPATVTFGNKTYKGSKARARLIHYFRFYLPWTFFEGIPPFQFDVNIHSCENLLPRSFNSNWVQSSQTGFSLVDGKTYVDGEDYCNNTDQPIYFPDERNLS